MPTHCTFSQGFFGPRSRPEGSCEIGSFRLSFRQSVSFLRVGSLVFSETKHDVKGLYIVACHSWIIWKELSSGKNNQKMVKNGPKTGFVLLKKISSLVLSGICVKRKFLWSINILRENWLLGKNMVLKL